jgi:hypothetical protein
MERDSGGLRLRLRKAPTLFIFCAVFLLLGWKISSADTAVIRHEPSLPVSLTYPGGVEVLKVQIPPKSNLFAQQKEVPSKGPAQGSVVINGVRLSDDKVKALEKQYRVRILPGDYWYDKMCGAWGFRGGPSAGLILPSLDLGGPLQSNASNGNTGVFINGRELHMLDVAALQQITPVFQGRYWVDAQGNIGLEGGPALMNLWMLANSRSVKKEGILSTYDKTGVAVIGY